MRGRNHLFVLKMGKYIQINLLFDSVRFQILFQLLLLLFMYFSCHFFRCSVRFTHANRHCPSHPTAVLKRSNDFVLRPIMSNESNEGGKIQAWLER